MSRLLVVSFQEYRNYQLELRDSGGQECSVVVHPPAGQGEGQEIPRDGGSATLVELIDRAKKMIDGVLGPRPPPRQLGQRGHMAGVPRNAQ